MGTKSKRGRKEEIYVLLYFASDNTVSNLEKFKVCARNSFTKKVGSVEKTFVEVGYGSNADIGEILHEGTLKDIKAFAKQHYPTHSMNDESDKENEPITKSNEMFIFAFI